MSVTPFPSPYRRDRATGILRAQSPLGESIRNLAHSLRPATESAHALTNSEPTLRDQLRRLLDPLREAFAAHRAATEGDEGIYAEMVDHAPRLARTVDDLVAEHRAIDSAMATLARWADEVSADAEILRRRATDVLNELTLHRQHDSDLVYEAYATDIGGE
jgi:hypothetical protein